MRTSMLTAALFCIGLIVTTQGCVIERPKLEGLKDLSQLVQHHAEQAEKNRHKAQDWEDLADYYEKFPDAYSGKMSVAEHISILREAAQDLRKDAEEHEEQAEKKRELIRKGAGT